jgi:hypothetical protein
VAKAAVVKGEETALQKLLQSLEITVLLLLHVLNVMAIVMMMKTVREI